MTEGEAKRIFEEKLPLCEALGLDVRAKCLEAGVPPAMIEKLLAAHKAMRVAMSRLVRDPSVLPTSGNQKAVAEVGFLCLNQACTGLPMIVWAMARVDSRRSPYLRVQSNHAAEPQISSAVDLSVEEAPRVVQGTGLSTEDFRHTSTFIKGNLEVLRGYWDGSLGSYSFLKRIRRVE